MSLSETSGPEGEASQLLAFSAFFAKTQQLTGYCIHRVRGLPPCSAYDLILPLNILLSSSSRAPKSVPTLQRPRITFSIVSACYTIVQQ